MGNLDSTEWRTVVGVARVVRYHSLREAIPTIFLPARQSVTQGMFAMRTAGDPRRARRIDPARARRVE